MDILEMPAEFTPGTWKWRYCLGGLPELVNPKHGMLLVMDAVRSGMDRAEIRFGKRSVFDKGGLMLKASEMLPKPAYRQPDYPEVANPDMRLIAAAPELFDCLRAVLKAQRVDGKCSFSDLEIMAMGVIAKVLGVVH